MEFTVYHDLCGWVLDILKDFGINVSRISIVKLGFALFTLVFSKSRAAIILSRLILVSPLVRASVTMYSLLIT